MKDRIIEEVLKTVSEVTRVKTEDIISECKRNEVLEARQLFVWYCKVNGGCVVDILRFINRKHANCITEIISKYHSNYARYTMFRMMADKISRVLPPRLKKLEEEEAAKDMEVIMNSTDNCSANDTPK